MASKVGSGGSPITPEPPSNKQEFRTGKWGTSIKITFEKNADSNLVSLTLQKQNWFQRIFGGGINEKNITLNTELSKAREDKNINAVLQSFSKEVQAEITNKYNAMLGIRERTDVIAQPILMPAAPAVSKSSVGERMKKFLGFNVTSKTGAAPAAAVKAKKPVKAKQPEDTTKALLPGIDNAPNLREAESMIRSFIDNIKHQLESGIWDKDKQKRDFLNQHQKLTRTISPKLDELYHKNNNMYNYLQEFQKKDVREEFIKDAIKILKPFIELHNKIVKADYIPPPPKPEVPVQKPEVNISVQPEAPRKEPSASRTRVSPAAAGAGASVAGAAGAGAPAAPAAAAAQPIQTNEYAKASSDNPSYVDMFYIPVDQETVDIIKANPSSNYKPAIDDLVISKHPKQDVYICARIHKIEEDGTVELASLDQEDSAIFYNVKSDDMWPIPKTLVEPIKVKAWNVISAKERLRYNVRPARPHEVSAARTRGVPSPSEGAGAATSAGAAATPAPAARAAAAQAGAGAGAGAAAGAEAPGKLGEPIKAEPQVAILNLENLEWAEQLNWDNLAKNTPKVNAHKMIEATLYSLPPEPGVNTRFKNIECAVDTAINVEGRILHANRVADFNESAISFVAGQAPMPSEVNAFWKGIFTNDYNIVDLTTDTDQAELNRYFPTVEGEPKPYGNLTVKLKPRTAASLPGFVEYEVTDGKITKTIKRFHYSQWKDFQAVGLHTLIDLVGVLEKQFSKGKLWTHCRAGVGRTGTLITAFRLKEEIANRKKAGLSTSEAEANKIIAKLILQMRSRRSESFVQQPVQLDLLKSYGKHLIATPA